MMRSKPILAFFILMAGTCASAQLKPAAPAPQPAATFAPTLKPGSPAPALSVAKWVKGEPLTGFESGRIYVVEFWATWCGPCVATIPHLTELQTRYADKGVTVVGVTTEDPNNGIGKIEKFVEHKGELMGYRVAFDRGKETALAYMRAAGVGTIPTAFVVDKSGTIVSIGHPLDLDMVLERVVAGTWDAEKSPAEIAEVGKLRTTILRQGQSDPAGALKTYAAFVAKFPSAGATLEDFHYKLLARTGDEKAAAEVGERLVTKWTKEQNELSLNSLAWDIVRPDSELKSKDLDLASAAASAAVRLSGEKDEGSLDTLARVFFLQGKVEKAIEAQTKAVDVANEKLKPELQKTLDEYKAKR